MKVKAFYKCRSCNTQFTDPNSIYEVKESEYPDKIQVDIMHNKLMIPCTDLVYRKNALAAPLIKMHTKCSHSVGIADLIYLCRVVEEEK